MWIAVAALVLAGACGRPGPAPAGPAQVDVAMVEFAFAHVQSVPAGRVVLRAGNAGREDHELVLVALPADLPPLAAQLQGDERSAVPTVARVSAVEPGGSGSVAVDLAPGRYGFICFVKGHDGTQHSIKGMSSELRVAV